MCVLGFGIFATLSGCCPHPPPVKTTAWTGPTDSMETVIREINRNNAAVPTLSTDLSFTASFTDDKKQIQTASGSGAMSYARPISLLISGDKDIAGQVFQLGSNPREFWVKIRSSADSSRYFWGHQANLGKPGCQPLPIDPQLVIEVLGVSMHSNDFLQQPVPVMRFDSENDGSYVLDFNEQYNGGPGPDRWVTEKEIWYSRDKKLPTKVLLYDENGRVILRATLSNHGPVEVPNTSKEQWPTIARHYELSFTDSGNQITFDFDEPATQHKLRGIVYPNAGTFDRRHSLPDPNDTVIQIDKDCR